MAWVIAAVVLLMILVSAYSLRQRSRRSLGPTGWTDPRQAERMESQRAAQDVTSHLGRNGQDPGGFGGGLGSF